MKICLTYHLKKFFDIITCISTLEHIGFNNEIYNYGRYKTNKRAKIDIKKVLFNLKRVLKKWSSSNYNTIRKKRFIRKYAAIWT